MRIQWLAMQPISVNVVAQNEQENIGRCLESVRWADEIVVIDGKSTDQTPQIARQYTDRVIMRKWDGAVQQNNFAVSAASHDWIFTIDADEQVSGELAESIQQLRQCGMNCDAYRVPRRVFYMGRWIRYGGWYPDYKVRFFNRTKARWAGMDPHNKIQMDSGSAVGTLTGDLHHYTYQNVADHLKRVNKYTSIMANEMFQNNVRPTLWKMIGHPAWRFFRMYLLRGGLLDGRAGLAIATIGSFYVFLKYLKLWELQSGHSQSSDSI